MAIEYDKSRAYRLFDQGKVEGTWNPDDIDLSQDRDDWERFTAAEREQFLRFAAGFYDGEEDVTRTLAPHLVAVEQLDAEDLAFDPVHVTMFLCQQLYEEAKHTDFFARWHDVVVGSHDTAPYQAERYPDGEASYGAKALYPMGEELTRTALNDDQTAILHELGRAVMHYMGNLEAQRARVGYVRFDQMLAGLADVHDAESVLPGFREGIHSVRDDEGRHIGHGQWLLERIAATDPTVVTDVYQPMLEGYVDRHLSDGDRAGESPAIPIDKAALDRAFVNYLQETIDRIGRERFDGFSEARELFEQRADAGAAPGDD